MELYFFSGVTNAYASILTMDSVSKQFNQSTIVTGISEFGSTLTSKVNASDKTLDIYSDDEKIFSFVYGDDYIEYDNRDTVITEENCDDEIFSYFWIEGIIESVFILSGYNNKGISEDVDYTNTYDTYGIQMVTESFKFSGDEDGSSWSISGEYLRYFKISLDTEKIDTLISKYGVDIENQDPNKEIINGLIPTLSADNITENSVTLYPRIDYLNTDPDYSVNCFIYRSNSEDGTYEKISDMAVNCLDDSVSIVDEGLKSNTTYYYKAIVDGGTIYSNPLEVTTKGNSFVTNNNYQEEDIENPQTGVYFPIITMVLLITCSIAVMMYFKKIYLKEM